jgi:hypothetical protein
MGRVRLKSKEGEYGRATGRGNSRRGGGPVLVGLDDLGHEADAGAVKVDPVVHPAGVRDEALRWHALRRAAHVHLVRGARPLSTST